MESGNNFEALLTEREVAAMLHVTPKGVQSLARRGILPGRKVGRYWRFRRSWIERWLEEGGDGTQAISGGAALAAQGREN